MNVIRLIFFSFFIFFSQLFAAEEVANVTHVQLIRNPETEVEKLARQKIRLAEITSQREQQKKDRIKKIEEFAANCVDHDKQEFEIVNFEIIDMKLFDSECNLGDIKVTLMYDPKKKGECSLLFNGNDISNGSFTKNFNFKDDEAFYKNINAKKKFGLQLEAADFSVIKFPISRIIYGIQTEIVPPAQEGVFKYDNKSEVERERQDLELIKKIEEFSVTHAKPFGRQGAQRFDVINANRIDGFENPKGLHVTLAYNFAKIGLWNISFSSGHFKENFTRVLAFADPREEFEALILSDMNNGIMFGLKLEAFGWKMIKFSINEFELTGDSTIPIPKPIQIKPRPVGVSAEMQKKLDEEKSKQLLEKEKQAEEAQRLRVKQLQEQDVKKIDTFVTAYTKYNSDKLEYLDITDIQLFPPFVNLVDMQVTLTYDSQHRDRCSLSFSSSFFKSKAFTVLLVLKDNDNKCAILEKINDKQPFGVIVSNNKSTISFSIDCIYHSEKDIDSDQVKSSSTDSVDSDSVMSNEDNVNETDFDHVKSSSTDSLDFDSVMSNEDNGKAAEESKRVENKHERNVSWLQWCKQFPFMTTGVCFACCATIIVLMHKNSMFNRLYQYC